MEPHMCRSTMPRYTEGLDFLRTAAGLSTGPDARLRSIVADAAVGSRPLAYALVVAGINKQTSQTAIVSGKCMVPSV